MAIHSYVYNVLADQHAITVALDTPEIIQAAKHVAFYCAMLDAQKDDPFDNAEDNAEMHKFLSDQLKTFVECYQDLVNNEL